ncbi:glucose-6-phosphate isomerase [Patescibacteria group bacterium]|nr:glucose-6-phosphate isomerase [Patescibacteria group bacterium]MBU4162399.1 glucose-6-phosphate isomerase [Patescibacteria group bacterium]
MEDFNLENLKPDIRTIKDMGSVLYDKEWQKTADIDTELYYMYRGLKEKNNLRYDITVILPIMLGNEFNKTKGHTHTNECGETYIILEGEAIFLLQKENNDTIEDVYAVKAKKGEVCIVPLLYSHITINPTDKTLKMANWVDKEMENSYEEIQQRNGACYFYTTQGWIKNEDYKNVPALRFENAQASLPEELSCL